MQPAVRADGQRRLRSPDLLDRRPVVDILLAIPFEGGVPPGLARLRDVELGQLVGDVRMRQLFVARDFVAKAYAVIVDPEHDGHPPLVPVLLIEADRQLVVTVADGAILAPRLLPSLVEAARRLSCQCEVAEHLGCVGKKKTEAAFRDHRLALAADRIADATFRIERHVDLQRPGRRRRAGNDLGGRRCLRDGLRGGGNGDE